MGLVLTPLFSENFSPDANPLNPANWQIPAALPGLNYTALQAIGGVCEATVTDTVDPNNLCIEEVKVAMPNDCYASVVGVSITNGAAGGFELYVRGDANFANNYIFSILDDGLGTGTVDVALAKFINDVQTTLRTRNQPFVPGLVWTLAVIGNTLFTFAGGQLVYQVTDNSLSSGQAALDIIVVNSVSECTVDNFVAGSAAFGGSDLNFGSDFSF